MRLVWYSAAEADLRRAIAFIAADNPQAAADVKSRLRSAVGHLERFPDAGRRGRKFGTREIVVPEYPYIIRYRVKDGGFKFCGCSTLPGSGRTKASPLNPQDSPSLAGRDVGERGPLSAVSKCRNSSIKLKHELPVGIGRGGCLDNFVHVLPYGGRELHRLHWPPKSP